MGLRQPSRDRVRFDPRLLDRDPVLEHPHRHEDPHLAPDGKSSAERDTQNSMVGTKRVTPSSALVNGGGNWKPGGMTPATGNRPDEIRSPVIRSGRSSRTTVNSWYANTARLSNRKAITGAPTKAWPYPWLLSL
jgi:hypothetical protein